jgi:hypothetical protein
VHLSAGRSNECAKQTPEIGTQTTFKEANNGVYRSKMWKVSRPNYNEIFRTILLVNDSRGKAVVACGWLKVFFVSFVNGIMVLKRSCAAGILIASIDVHLLYTILARCRVSALVTRNAPVPNP